MQGCFVISPLGGGGLTIGGGNTNAYTLLADTAGTSSPPVQSGLRWNNATQTSATELFIDAEATDLTSIRPVLLELKPGAILRIRSVDDPAQFQNFLLTTVTDNTTFVTLGVAFDASGGSAFSDTDEIFLVIDTRSDDGDGSGQLDSLEFGLESKPVTSLIGGLKTDNAGGSLTALGANSITIITSAVSPTNTASGAFGIAIGTDVIAADSAVVLGEAAFGTTEDVSIGKNAIGVGGLSVQIGSGASGAGARSLAMALNALASGGAAVSLGAFSDATQAGAVAIGGNRSAGAQATGECAVAIAGDNDLAGALQVAAANVSGDHSVGLGGDINIDLADVWQIRGNAIIGAVPATPNGEIQSGTSTVRGSHVIDVTQAVGDTQTSGTLEIGALYEITTYVATDDFINVGAASNANGIVFIATGTTPTDYTNGSTLTLLSNFVYEFPANSVFYPDGLDVIIIERTVGGGGGVEPSFEAGNNDSANAGDHDFIKTVVTTTNVAADDRDTFNKADFASVNGVTSISFDITTATNNDSETFRVFFEGKLIRDQ